jgi:hypothetical protein
MRSKELPAFLEPAQPAQHLSQYYVNVKEEHQSLPTYNPRKLSY